MGIPTQQEDQLQELVGKIYRKATHLHIFGVSKAKKMDSCIDFSLAHPAHLT